MFKQIKRCINSSSNHAWINVSLPAVESVNSKDEFTIVADPALSVDEIMQVLKDNWTEEYIKKMMLTRFIAVICDNSIRTHLAKFCEDNADATQDEINASMQQYVDSGWNVDLKHPATDRSMQSVKKKQTTATNVLKDANTEVQARAAKTLLEANPELAKELAKLLK